MSEPFDGVFAWKTWEEEDLVVESISYLQKKSKIFPNLTKFIKRVKEKGYKFPTYQKICQTLNLSYVGYYSLVGNDNFNPRTRIITYEIFKKALSDYMEELDDNERYLIDYDFETLAIMQLKQYAWGDCEFAFDDIKSPSVLDL